MATFLELVNDVARESGTVSESAELSTVVGATGRLRKIVGWTRQAWEMIQRSRNDWTFTRKAFTASLVAGQTEYDPVTDLGITDFGRWLPYGDDLGTPTIYNPAIGRGDETPLVAVPFRNFARQYLVGAPQEIRPGVFAAGGQTLYVGGPPDQPYTMRGWYRRNLQTLTADDDEPIVSNDHHQVIVWRALMLLGDDDEAPFEVGSSMAQYEQMYHALVRDYTDPIVLG